MYLVIDSTHTYIWPSGFFVYRSDRTTVWNSEIWRVVLTVLNCPSYILLENFLLVEKIGRKRKNHPQIQNTWLD